MTPEQLKASILQRAMEGKLVPQDPTDEPASELLKRIKAEKENLIADGKIKRDKKETELFRGADGKPYEKLSDGTIKEVEVPYDIPASWEWVRLRNISSLSFFPNISGDKIPNYSWVLDMEDIEKETGRLVRKNYKTEKSSYKSNKVYFSKDTVLYAKLRPNLKKVIISDEDGFATTELIPIKIFGGISAEYMRYCMISPSYYFNIIKSVYGVKMPRVNATFLNSTLLPLPPLSEQKRIVEQIERALEKVDAYSESYNKLQELDKSFPDKLKKSILQYTMQGKLVPQDPNDEPVEVLLEKIQAEKQKLYEEGKLKKKDLAEIVVTKGDDNSPYKEVPYNIPKSWEWVRLGNISSLNFFSSISGDKIPNDSWVLDMEDIEKETGRLVRKNYKTEKSSYKSNKISFSKDTILYAKLRPNLKKVIISDENGFATTELLPIKVFGNISLDYIRYCMISPFYYFNIIQSVYGVKMPRVSSGFLNSTLLPLPPLTEQQRIVSKISQVFSVIESLV
ncbi:TPA: restriction endonuclease subunit S [Streptococcus agalactiae]|uniref:restriction endonuclease subunit S n=3 Tax=Streptococcus agalactiae TaxID=1311 RepID=UPI00137524F6|nr:restriction endonuclease subunit S [Streptococcus agalactiae]KAF1186672.1 type I restriction endonuclease [Streptococcus agalactiae]HEM9579065.1 restriction endonuclease subunit S [Streptococcus agalactiae]HEM9581240.1 restriction endonuclease subunit S [Streptococcus agalactiae]HEM9589971.1 restriction endonuclease subunit S [Streptococcus agalactiae]HEM9596542.1 restriction endonuclease subunit S [Streptococcus agalactiae]